MIAEREAQGLASLASATLGLGPVLGFMDAACGRAGLGGRERHDLRLAVEEVCANILVHGYGGEPGPVRLAFEAWPEHWAIIIEDQAPPFDPATAPEPDLTSAWEARAPGGQGWRLVRALVDDIHYEALPGGNRVTLIKAKTPGGTER